MPTRVWAHQPQTPLPQLVRVCVEFCEIPWLTSGRCCSGKCVCQSCAIDKVRIARIDPKALFKVISCRKICCLAQIYPPERNRFAILARGRLNLSGNMESKLCKDKLDVFGRMCGRGKFFSVLSLLFDRRLGGGAQ